MKLSYKYLCTKNHSKPYRRRIITKFPTQKATKRKTKDISRKHKEANTKIIDVNEEENEKADLIRE